MKIDLANKIALVTAATRVLTTIVFLMVFAGCVSVQKREAFYIPFAYFY